MRHPRTPLVLTLLVGSCALPSRPAGHERPTAIEALELQPYVPGELLVSYADGAGAEVEDLHALVGARVLERDEVLRAHRVALPEGLTVARALERYSSASSSVRAEANHLLELNGVPSDPIWYTQSGARRIGCEVAWDLERGQNNVVIAIVDSGVDFDHPDLTGADVFSWSVTGTDITDVTGHGTVMALILGGRTNAQGVSGVAPGCKLTSVKMLSDDAQATTWSAAMAIKWAADSGAHVINASFAGPWPGFVLESSCDYAAGENCVVVASSGNYGTDEPTYPAAFDSVLAVSGSDLNDQHYSLSNFGPWCAVAAPAAPIAYQAPEPVGDDGEWDDGAINSVSAACALVSGVAGLVFSRLGPDTPREVVVQHIVDSCDPVFASESSGGGADWVRFGRVNAFGALTGQYVPGHIASHPPWGHVLEAGRFLPVDDYTAADEPEATELLRVDDDRPYGVAATQESDGRFAFTAYFGVNFPGELTEMKIVTQGSASLAIKPIRVEGFVPADEEWVELGSTRLGADEDEFHLVLGKEAVRLIDPEKSDVRLRWSWSGTGDVSAYFDRLLVVTTSYK